MGMITTKVLLVVLVFVVVVVEGIHWMVEVVCEDGGVDIETVGRSKESES
jgi:hypothetical protein